MVLVLTKPILRVHHLYVVVLREFPGLAYIHVYAYTNTNFLVYVYGIRVCIGVFGCVLANCVHTPHGASTCMQYANVILLVYLGVYDQP